MENTVIQHPYIFKNTEYFSLDSLLKVFVTSTENMQAGKALLLDGSIMKWLIENSDYASSAKLMNEITTYNNHPDILITRVIYLFIPNEPFFLKGDKILAMIKTELLGSVENFKLTNTFLSGKMIMLYRAYYDVTQNKINSLDFLSQLYDKIISIESKKDKILFLRKNINLPTITMPSKKVLLSNLKVSKSFIIQVCIVLSLIGTIPLGIFIVQNSESNIAKQEKEENKFDLLTEAVNFGSVQKVALLMKEGCDLNMKNQQGNTILASSWHADVNMIKFLLNNGFNINSKNANGNTLLINSVDEFDKVQLLLDRGASVDAKNNDGETALMKSKGATMTYLLDHKANVNAKDNRGNTVIMKFASSSLDVIKLLVERGADINAKNNDGLTLLMMEVSSKNEDPRQEKTKYLLSKGAYINAVANNGKSVLDYAAPIPELTKLLLDSGAISNKIFKQRAVKKNQMTSIQTSTQPDNGMSTNIDTLTNAIKEEMNLAYKNSTPPGTVETLVLITSNNKDYTGKAEINFEGEIQKVTVEVNYSNGKYSWKAY